MRKEFFIVSLFVFLGIAALGQATEGFYWLLLIAVPLFLLGLHDIFQTRQTIKRNFPVIGNFRYLLEAIRPEIQQYFVESNEDGMPFSREKRSVVYQRSKKVTDTIAFGTQNDLYRQGHQWINHSINARHPIREEPRVVIGETRCSKPYSSSRLNISAMSFGALSANAIMALNRGAKLGGFAHNTGEGGVSPHHLKYGGDLIWQIGTGYFGCRTDDGKFDEEKFAKTAQGESIKMIEIKISQGAKPGHGGVLPGSKVTREIADIRGVIPGRTVISPPAHSAFKTPKQLLSFIIKLRKLSGGKPVGIKLCIGRKKEFFAFCKAIVETNEYPDFISIDGAEGGTGAAPLEFANSIGTPLDDGLSFANNAIRGIGFRDQITIIASGKVITGFNIAAKIALGADICQSARGMMFSLGCIQALRCNHNNCPAGIATQDKALEKGLVVEDKFRRVSNFHGQTIKSFLEVIAAAGLQHPKELEPYHLYERISPSESKHFGEIYPFVRDGAFLENEIPESYQMAWELATSEVF